MSVYVPSEEELIQMEQEERQKRYYYKAQQFRERGILPGGIYEDVPLENLRPYPEHPFRLYEDERLSDLIQSVRDCGVLTPIIVRELDDMGKQILAGHNRVAAAKACGHTTIPAMVIGAITDEEAMLIVTETNLAQRSFADLTHSERAKALSERHKALSCQGKRRDLLEQIKSLMNAVDADEQGDNTTCAPLAHKLKTRDKIGENFGLSKDTIARYLRVNELIQPLKERLDGEEIAIRSAVHLSYLSQEEQEVLEDLLLDGRYRVDEKKASLLRAKSKAGKLDESTFQRILAGEQMRKPKAPAPFKLRHDVVSKYFAPEQKAKEVEEIIDQALAEYFEKHAQ